MFSHGEGKGALRKGAVAQTMPPCALIADNRADLEISHQRATAY